MPGASRSLPDRPNLRYLRLEAKRRLAAGEFATLHDAQLAIAREYGEPSWAALKQAIGEPETPEPGSHALDQLRWLRDRFSGADQPGWTTPAEFALMAAGLESAQSQAEMLHRHLRGLASGARQIG